MRRTVEAAARRGVVVGAHPSYPDRDGFGRRPMDMARAQVTEEVVRQVAALDAVARESGTRVHYVKPHGALYHRMARGRGVRAGRRRRGPRAGGPGPPGPDRFARRRGGRVGRGAGRHRGLRRPRL